MIHKNILLLEDDLQLSDTIKQFLEHHDYSVIVAYDAREAIDQIYEMDIDLMLLDIKVPYQSGFDLLKDIRDSGDTTPAIFITSLNSVDDVTRGFDVGCDDYIRKPFALKELLVRIEALLKRKYNTREEYIAIDETLKFYPDEYQLYRGQERLPLKTKEAKLLALLLEYPDKLLSYEKIFDTIWSYDEEPSAGSLRTYIKTIRAYIGKEHIETLKSVGYRFVP
jgi:DNA-binding response OmpR family regulator